MKRITVQVRNDHLEFLARAKPMTAVAELVWNALDADATEVRVDFIENELDGVEAIRISDNGHGLHYDHALVVFQNLGGSWKRDGMRSAERKRVLHGKYGKGRFRAFTLGNRVDWRTTYEHDGALYAFSISGHATTLGAFDLSDPQPANGATGLAVEIGDVPASIELLRGTKAVQEVTDLFALYLRQYPGVRIVYDGVPLDPANAEERHTDLNLGELVMPNGERVPAALTVVEWNLPGKRSVMLCDEHGFALHECKPRLLFRGFSYTAYIKSPHTAALDREGLLQMEEMAPDVRILLDAARAELRRYFSLREAEQNMDALAVWKNDGIYPYESDPQDPGEENERRIFDIYATHLSQITGFAALNRRNKRLILRLVQEIVRTEPTRVARILDELLTFPEEKEEAVLDLMGG